MNLEGLAGSDGKKAEGKEGQQGAYYEEGLVGLVGRALARDQTWGGCGGLCFVCSREALLDVGVGLWLGGALCFVCSVIEVSQGSWFYFLFGKNPLFCVP
jgi:hypothetical protein